MISVIAEARITAINMGILQNLVQGLAGAAGNDQAVDAIQKNKDDRVATHKEELHGRSKAILDDVAKLQERRAALPPGSPEIANIDKSLQEHQQAFTDLYHPTKNPGALQHLGDILKQHISGKAPAPAPPSNAMTPQRMAGLQASAAGTAQPEADAWAKFSAQYKGITGKDPDASLREQFARKQGGITEPKETPTKFQNQLTETTDAQGVKHYWRVPLEEGGKPEEVNFNGEKVTPKGAPPKPVRAWKKDKSGKITSVLIDPQTNKAIAGSENGDILPPAAMGGRISTGYYHFVDDQGNVHQVQETHTSMPVNGAGGGAPSPVKTPGAAKAMAPKSGGDSVLGHKETPVQAKAHNAYVAAYTLSEAADLVAKEPDNAQGQKSLAVALERAAAGRFTTQALDYINKAGWNAAAEQFWNNIDNGTLPAVVMKNLIQRAHDNKDSTYLGWQESLKGSQSAAKPSADTDIDDIVKALNKK